LLGDLAGAGDSDMCPNCPKLKDVPVSSFDERRGVHSGLVPHRCWSGTTLLD